MNGSGPNNDVAATIEQRNIDDQVSQLQARICSLKTKRNTYARISQLPAEIMSEIFITAKWSSLSARRWYKIIPFDDSAYSGERNWLNVAGVCTRWRQLALQCPRLWSAIDLTFTDRALGMIKRSKSAPLDVSCPNIKDIDEVAQLVMSNIHRIRTLDLGAANDGMLFDFLRLNERESAPLLRALTLRGPMYSSPRDILERDMSSLQELNLIKGTLTSPLPPFPHLKKLCVDPTQLVPGHLSIDILCQTLQNTPNLEELRACQVVVPSDAPMSQTLPLVHLPHLTNLDISGLAISSAKLFEIIKYPKATSVLYLCDYFTPGSDYSHLINALTHFVSLPGRVIDEITVTTLGDFSITLKDAPQFTAHGFELTLNGVVFEFLAEATAILAAIPLSKAATLHLNGIARGTIEPRPFFARCKEVEDLMLTTCPAEILCALKKDNDSTLLLPTLRKLWVEDCTFIDSSGEPNLAMQMCKAVKSTLKQRKRLNVGIEELVLLGCDITRSVVEQFQKYAPVHWDKSEGEAEDVDEDQADYSDDEDWSGSQGSYAS